LRHRVKIIVQIFRCIRKRFVWKLCHSKSICIYGTVLLAKHVDVEVDKNSELRIGTLTTIEKNCLLAARGDAKIDIGKKVYINRNSILVAHEAIVLKDGVTIGPNCCIYDHDHDLKNTGSYITSAVCINENTWLGAGCIVLKGVTIGKNCVIGAGSVVTKDVPDNTLLCNRIEYRRRLI